MAMTRPEIDLQTMRILRAVADTGSLSGAARDLGFSQPAISQHLSRSAQKLGLPLVTRSGRGVRLTEAGAALARHAVTVQSALDAASGELDDLIGLRSGSLRIAAFPTASATVVPRLLGGMSERHPGMRLSYVEAEPPEALELLRHGRVDIAITFRYPDDWNDPHTRVGDELVTVALFDDEVLIAERMTAPQDERPSARGSLADYSDDDWIAGCPQCRGNLLQACQAAGFHPRIAHETDHAAAVLGLVENGFGVAQLPRLAFASATVPEHVRLSRVSGLPHRTVYAVALRAASGVPAVAAALRVASELDTSDWTESSAPA